MSREVLAAKYRRDEFMADARIQTPFSTGKFNSLLQQFGPEARGSGVVRGPRRVGKTDRRYARNRHSTYGRKFMRALGSQGQPQKSRRRDPHRDAASTAGGRVNAMSAGISSPSASLSEEVAAFEQTPEYRAQFPA